MAVNYSNHDISTSGLITASSGNFINSLQVNGTGVSLIGHTHTASDISDFNSSVSGLLPTITNSGNNRILTSTGGSIGISAEEGLTFDGSLLNIIGSIDALGQPLIDSPYNEKNPGIINTNKLVVNSCVQTGPFDYIASVDINGAALGGISLKPEDFAFNYSVFTFPDNGGGVVGMQDHVHGNITTSGAIGSTSGLLVVTASSGLLTTTSGISSSLITNFNSNVIGLLPVGTLNYLSKFGSGGSGLNNSVIYDDGTNIGVGVASPAEKLDVSGNIKVAGANTSLIIAQHDTTTMRIRSAANLIVGAGSAANIRFLISSTEHARLSDQGRFGIGLVSPSGKLGVAGGATIGSNYNVAPPTNGLIVEGNVGIGTTAPTSQLHVIGTGNFTQSLQVNGTGVSLTNHSHSSFPSLTLGGSSVPLNSFLNIDVPSGFSLVEYQDTNVFSINNIEDASLVFAVNGKGKITWGSIDAADVNNFNDTVTSLLPTIANSGNNRVLTSTGSSVGVNGESNLTFDGNLLSVTGSGNFTNNITASGFVRSGGTSSQFLKADGSVDSSTYLTSLSHNHGISNNAGTEQFTFGVNDNVRIAGSGSTSISFDSGTKQVTVSSTDTTYSAGSGLSLTGTTFSHTDTSSQNSVDNSNGTVIQDVTLDTYGHVTALNSIDLDGRYYTETEVDTALSAKQATLTNPVTGTGVSNHIAYWNSSSGITADSGQLYWDSTNNRLGIGTVSPQDFIHVSGATASAVGIRLENNDGYGGSISADNGALYVFSNNNTNVFSVQNNKIRMNAGGATATAIELTSAGSISQQGNGGGLTFSGTTAQFSNGVNVTGSGLFSGDVRTSDSFIGGSGTALLPSFEFVNDPDTGMFSPATNTIGLATSGVERLRINNIGNVGISYAVPTTKLQVNGTFSCGGDGGDPASGGQGLYVDPVAPLLRIIDTGPNTVADIDVSGLTLYDVASAPFFYTDRANARIGIGTTTPNATLHIVGSGLFTNSIQIGDPLSPDAGTLNIYTNDSSDFSATINLKNGSSQNRLSIAVNDDTASSEIISTNDVLYITNDTRTINITANQIQAIGNLDVAGNLTFDSFTESVVANGNSGTSKTLSLASGTVHTCTLTGNCTFTMPTATAGKSFSMFLNSGSGNYTASFSGVRWADSASPTATITASKVDIYSFISDGSYWYGSFSQNYG